MRSRCGEVGSWISLFVSGSFMHLKMIYFMPTTKQFIFSLANKENATRTREISGKCQVTNQDPLSQRPVASKFTEVKKWKKANVHRQIATQTTATSPRRHVTSVPFADWRDPKPVVNANVSITAPKTIKYFIGMWDFISNYAVMRWMAV